VLPLASTVALSTDLIGIVADASDGTYDLYNDFVEYEDAGNDWSSGVYTAPFTGEFTFRIWMHGEATRNNTNTSLLVATNSFFFLINDTITDLTNQWEWLQPTGLLATQTINTDFTKTISLNAGDTLKIQWSYSPDSLGIGAEPSATIDLVGNGANDYTGTGVELVSIGTLLTGDTVLMEFNAPDMKQIDFMTSIQKMFNLVFVADKTLPNTLRIEPMVEYIASGNTLDWSQKLDLSKDIMYSPTTDLQKAKFTFTYTEDGDYFNGIYKDNGRIYGRYEVTESDFEVINEFATGEEKVELASCCNCSLNIGARSKIPLSAAFGCTLTWKEPKSNTKRKPAFATLSDDATSINRCPTGVYSYGWSSIVIAILLNVFKLIF